MWYATTCNHKRRDFRIVNIDDPCHCGIGPVGVIAGKIGYCLNIKILWSKTVLEPTVPGGNVYKARMPMEKDGKWSAFFIDVTYEKNSTLQAWPKTEPGYLEFTTEVSIWPDTFPYSDCSGAECYGTLL